MCESAEVLGAEDEGFKPSRLSITHVQDGAV